MAIIDVRNISKQFKIIAGIQKGGIIKKIFSKRETSIIKAVDDVSFEIERGEIVGFLGQNGAGKSTTIKMLTGIIRPDVGEICVNGYDPFVNRTENSKNIGVVFGQRSQLIWDLSIEDTFVLHKKMYKIDDAIYKKNIEIFKEILGIASFSKQQVRQLSLGQKMRANLAVALLHSPEVVYLDEPTIGLDVLAKDNIRNFIREINKEQKTTIILTTHDMNDVEEICNKIMLIDKGKIIYNGSISKLKEQYGGEIYITVEFGNERIEIDDNRLVLCNDFGKNKKFKLERNITIGEAVSIITHKYKVKDIKIHEQGVEDIVKYIYTSK